MEAKCERVKSEVISEVFTEVYTKHEVKIEVEKVASDLKKYVDDSSSAGRRGSRSKSRFAVSRER